MIMVSASVLIEPFNYKRFASEGKDYLYDLYDNEEAVWHLEHTLIMEMPRYNHRFFGDGSAGVPKGYLKR